MGKIAITYTIKNEADLILQNINFHSKLGVDYFFVFLDNNTDNTEQLLRNTPRLSLRESIKPEELNDNFLSSKFSHQADNHDARRVFNTAWAAQEAKKIGCEWIISIDADELVLCNFNKLQKAEIEPRLNLVDNTVNQVVFRTYEQVPYFVDKSQGFSPENEFLTRTPIDLERSLYDPFSKQNLKLGRSFIGHDAGKTAFRLSALEDHYPLTHRWLKRSDDSPAELIKMNALLHFYFYDFQYFKRRFTNYQDRSNHSISDYQYPEHILLLIKLCQELSEEEFKEYYKEHICFKEPPKENFIKPKVLQDLLKF